MKKLISALILSAAALFSYAQKDVTQFLGIPVDGSKSEMIQKLKAKGFHTDPNDKEALTGSFNGIDVNVYIGTNGDKVCRIMVCDVNLTDERSIQIRFNNLCRQFENNPKYLFSNYKLIPEDEDISFEMNVKNKRYEAIFYQEPKDPTEAAVLEGLMPILLKKYTPEEMANPTEDVQKGMKDITLEYVTSLSYNKPVWFMISSMYGKYYITMFYDNEYNRANGEDL